MSEENLYTFENEEYRRTYWHTCSHVLAQAMKRLHPEVKLAIGPSIDNGFYYDFDTPEPFTEGQLAELEAAGRLRSVVTQNIDGLHQLAGSKRVWELHGSVHRNYCMRCRKPFAVTDIKEGTGVPRCACGGTVKPDVVLYEEGLDNATIEGAVADIQAADMLIIGGTSLAVYPAAGLINYFRGKRLVLINKSPTPYDGRASLAINAPIGEVLGQIKVR